MNEEDREMLAYIGKAVDKAIDTELDKHGADRAYYHFKLSVELLGSDMSSKLDDIVLMDDHELFCAFCGTRTYFYDSKQAMALCAKCYKASREKE